MTMSPHGAPLTPTTTPPHPAAYSVLIIPFGAMSGYVSVAMAFLCTRYELSVEDGALLIAAGCSRTCGSSSGRRWWTPR